MKYEPMNDEFNGDGLDLDKWNLGIAPWKGRQPALFSDKNVTVSDGKLHLTMRKEEVSEKFEKLGYKDYTSAALHTKVRSSYGYYEVKAKPMNSGGSSSFWFQVEDVPGWLTEIDVFEIGGKAKGFEFKYNMNLHVFRTPKEKKHWSVGGVWVAPWKLSSARPAPISPEHRHLPAPWRLLLTAPWNPGDQRRVGSRTAECPCPWQRA